jgi:PAS domain S-box-containing protein
MTHPRDGVLELASRRIVRLAPDTPMPEALRQLQDAGADAALVMQGQALLGTLGARERLRAMCAPLPPDTPVRELMSGPPCVVGPATSAREAGGHLLRHGGDILVVNDEEGDPLGLLGLNALLQQLGEGRGPALETGVREHASGGRRPGGQPPKGVGTVREVTELKWTQEQLKASESNFHAFFDQIQDFVFVLDGQGNIVHCNRHVTQRLGFSLEELVGRSVLQVHPQARRDEATRIVAAMMEGEADHCPVPLQTRSGRLVPVDTRVVVGQWNGAPALFGVSRDLSRVAASEEKFTKAFHLSPVAMAISDLHEGTFLEVNNAFCEVTGYREEEVIGNRSTDLGLFMEPEQRSRIVERLQETGHEKNMALRVRTKQGAQLHGLFSAAVLELQNRRVMMSQMMDVTAAMQVEEQLREREALLRATLNSTADGILVVGPRGDVLSANSKFQTLWRIPDELMSQGNDEKLLDFVLQQLVDPAAFIAGVRRLYDSDEMTLDALRFKDGRLFERYTVPLPMAQGRGRVWSFRDITETRRAQEAVREMDLRRKALWDASLDGIAIVDRDHRIVEANARFADMLGYSQEEVLGLHTWDYEANLSREDIEREFPDLTQVEARFETRHRRKDGVVFDVEISAKGRSVQDEPMVIIIVRDITERKQAQRDIQEAGQRFQTVVSSTTDGFWETTVDGRLLEVNDVYCRQSGYSRKELIEMPIWSLDAIDDIARISQRAGQIMERGSAVFESQHRRKDGSLWPVEISVSYLAAKGGRFIVFLRNIEERKADEQERLRMERELLQTRKMEALGQLAGGVAHEFNNMLAIILGHAGLLRARLAPPFDPRLSGYLDGIDQAGTRAKALVRQMLSFSRPREIQPERVALETAVQEAISLARGSMPSSIEIDYRPQTDRHDVYIDLGELQQLLTNLLINARDAMSGKGHIEIWVDVYRNEGEECRHCHSRIGGEWVQLSVADGGHGISLEDQSHIFEPFFSTKTVGEGTGLGLAVVQGIVDRAGAHILVDSAPGVGSHFRLLLPPAGPETADGGGEAVQQARPPATNLQGRVLVVDDEPFLVQLLEEVLKDAGLEVVTCGDGREALTLLLRPDQRFDLLVTDQTMPGLLGTELIGRVRSRHPAMKVIMCTGHSDQVDQATAAEQSIDRFLLKPVTPSFLLRVVQRLLPDEGAGKTDPP